MKAFSFAEIRNLKSDSIIDLKTNSNWPNFKFPGCCFDSFCCEEQLNFFEE